MASVAKNKNKIKLALQIVEWIQKVTERNKLDWKKDALAGIFKLLKQSNY